jgi:excisionase family DNA binding protein
MGTVLDDYVAVGEASRYLGISAESVRRLIRADALESVRDPRGQRWVSRASLKRFVVRRAAKARAGDRLAAGAP